MQLPPAQHLPGYQLLPPSLNPSATWTSPPSLHQKGSHLLLQPIGPRQLLRKVGSITRPTTRSPPSSVRMVKEWGPPERNDFEHFVQRSVSNRELPNRSGEPIPERRAKSATPSPMPKPKNNSEFVAWGEYTGTGKDQEFIAWKKRQIGEESPRTKRDIERKQSSSATSSEKGKENRSPTSPNSQQGTNDRDKANQPPARQFTPTNKGWKKGKP